MVSRDMADHMRPGLVLNGLEMRWVDVPRRLVLCDDTVTESFFSTIKTEHLDRRPWPTCAADKSAMVEWSEVFYNSQIRRSRIDQRAPSEDEKMYYASPQRAPQAEQFACPPKRARPKAHTERVDDFEPEGTSKYTSRRRGREATDWSSRGSAT